MLAAIAAGLGPVTPAFIQKRPRLPKIASKRLPQNCQAAFTPLHPDQRTFKRGRSVFLAKPCRVLAVTAARFKSP
jgi:hypothetical protein